MNRYTEFTPYGSTFKQTGTYDPKHKFTGKELDSTTGLYFYGSRYYDPELGRFITADTIVQSPYDPQSLNRYSYCRNNPINYVDPTGNFWFIPLIIAAVKGAIAGALIGGAVAAVTGGNIGQGFLTGAISGAIFGTVGGLQLQGMAHTIGHTIGGAASGAANASITGDDIGMNALIGGLSAGASERLGSFGPLKDVAGGGFGGYINNVIRRAFIGSVIGGSTSAVMGGSFGYGAAQGAKTSAIAYAANEAMHEMQEIAKEALNTDKSKETLIASGKQDLRTGQERKIFLGKDLLDNDIKNLGLLGKTLGIMTGTPTFSIVQVKYNYEMQEEWATFNMKWNFDTGDLIEKTQIHGTEYWKHSYYYKETYSEPGGMPPNYRADR